MSKRIIPIEEFDARCYHALGARLQAQEDRERLLADLAWLSQRTGGAVERSHGGGADRLKVIDRNGQIIADGNTDEVLALLVKPLR